MRNLYKYTKMYSNAEPDLEEGDVFKVTIPINNLKVGGNNSFKNLNVGIDEPKNERNELERNILKLIQEDNCISQKRIQAKLGVSLITIRRKMAELQKNGVIVRIGSNRNGYWEIIE